MALIKSQVSDQQFLSEILIVNSWSMSVVFTHSNAFCPFKTVIDASNHPRFLMEVDFVSPTILLDPTDMSGGKGTDGNLLDTSNDHDRGTELIAL